MATKMTSQPDPYGFSRALKKNMKKLKAKAKRKVDTINDGFNTVPAPPGGHKLEVSDHNRAPKKGKRKENYSDFLAQDAAYHKGGKR